MAEIQTQVSKQVKPFPATISRGPVPHLLGWRSLYTRYGYLTTDQLRRLGNWGLPGAAKATLIHQMTGLSWQILNPDEEEDQQTGYYTLLIEHANDGVGGPVVFFNRLADDILTALEGGCFEIVRQQQGVPVALYNVDASTIKPAYDAETPYYQKDPYTGKWIPFSLEEMAQILWYPFVEIESPFFSRTPVQMAYTALIILADGDDYNMRLLKEVIPQGIVNLGKECTLEQAREWKEEWDKAKEGGRLNDIGLIWGTEGPGFIRLYPPPKDMGFENLEHWYATIIAACFEMSILDLGILTKISTKAAAESQERVSKRQGLRHLMQLIKQAIELYILPEGYIFQWEDIDPTDEKDDAEIKWRRAVAVRMLCDALGQDLGAQEAARQGLLTQETREELEAVQKATTKAAGEGLGVGGPQQGVGGTDWCVCPECGYRTEHERGTACQDVRCPKCNTPMVGEHALNKSVAGLENLPIVPLTNMMAEMYEAVQKLVEGLQNNDITLATFEDGMKELLREYYFQLYEAVEGEPTPETDYFLETLLEDELGYLAGFVGDLRQEIDSTGAIGGKAAARASLYVSHLNSAWQRILIEKLPPLETDVDYIVIWHLTPGAEHCNTCLMMAEGGPYTLDQLRSINIFPGHNTDCRANCMCYLEVRTRKKSTEE